MWGAPRTMGEATTTLPLRCNPFPLDGEGWDGGEIPALTKLLAGVTPIPRFAGTSPSRGKSLLTLASPLAGEGILGTAYLSITTVAGLLKLAPQ